SIRYVAEGGRERPHEAAMLRTLRRAILGRHSVRFSYHARHSQDGAGAFSTREADPYGLVFYLGAWHMTGFCHLRQDIRIFRVERMQQLSVLPRSFTRLPGYRFEQRDRNEERTLVVRALFDLTIADWVREEPSYFVVGEQLRHDGLLITLRVRHERDVLQWLLGWGSHVRVLEPQSLRALLADEAKKILEYHTTSDSH